MNEENDDDQEEEKCCINKNQIFIKQMFILVFLVNGASVCVRSNNKPGSLTLKQAHTHTHTYYTGTNAY